MILYFGYVIFGLCSIHSFIHMNCVTLVWFFSTYICLSYEGLYRHKLWLLFTDCFLKTFQAYGGSIRLLFDQTSWLLYYRLLCLVLYRIIRDGHLRLLICLLSFLFLIEWYVIVSFILCLVLETLIILALTFLCGWVSLNWHSQIIILSSISLFFHYIYIWYYYISLSFLVYHIVYISFNTPLLLYFLLLLFICILASYIWYCTLAQEHC